jgi:hypothetical protein
MHMATDRIFQRRIGVSLILFAVIGQSGCAKMRAWKQSSYPYSNQPVQFGTDFPPIDNRPGFAPPGTVVTPGTVVPPGTVFPPGTVVPNDPYLQQLKPKAAPGPAPATDPSAAKPATIIPTVTSRTTSHPQVALTAPILTASNSVRAHEPAQESAPVGPTLDSVIAASRQAVDKLSTYQVRMSHQERINGILQPPDDVLMSVRRSPKAIRLEWTEGTHKGREVIYVADNGKGMMHVHMGDSLLPIPDMTMPPDSPMAMRNSRHPINEAGLETVVERLEANRKPEAATTGEAVKFTYEGREQPAGLDKACDKIVRINATGEQWLVYLDPDHHLPVLIQGTAANGELLERHVFRDPTLEVAELAAPTAFDPVARWGQPRGLFQKLARAGSAVDDREPKPQ